MAQTKFDVGDEVYFIYYVNGPLSSMETGKDTITRIEIYIEGNYYYCRGALGRS